MRCKDAQAIAERFKDNDGLLQQPDELEVPQFITSAIPQLALYTDGLRCEVEPEECYYICRSEKGMREHCRKEHGWTRYKRGGRYSLLEEAEAQRERPWPWTSVTCQRFVASGKGARFFEVLDSIQNLEEDGAPTGLVGNESLVELLDRGSSIVEQAEQRVRSIITEGEVDEVSPWLKRTGWTQCLLGLDRKDLLRSIDEPDGEGEPVNKAIWDATGELGGLMQHTIEKKVGHFVRMEVARTERHRTHYQPLKPYQDRASIHKYARPWKQIIMFFARTRTRHEWASPKYRFNSRQKSAWTSLVARAAQAVAQRQRSVEDADELTALQSAILQFCIALLDQPARAHEYRCPMVCALAVLGVHKEGWMTPDTYPQMLTLVIKLARFMVVQLALRDGGPDESDSSSCSGESNDPEEQGKMGCLSLVVQMVDRFMIRGTWSPMQWMLDLRSYGMKIHFNTTREGTVQWEGERILYKTKQMTMHELRGAIHGLVAKAKQVLVKELLMVEDGSEAPQIPWSSMRDNPAETGPGYSFLGDRRTDWGALDGRGWLKRRVLAADALSRRFVSRASVASVDRASIAAYAARVADFQEQLLVLMHVTGGQPARMPELLSVRHANTIEGECRNIFIEDGLVVFVTRYHKGLPGQG